ncbi:unnamed protein product [Ectocarpus fasciculatus]
MRVGDGLEAREGPSLSWPSTEDAAGDIETSRLTLPRADHCRTDGCLSTFGVTSRGAGKALASASRCPAKLPIPSPSSPASPPLGVAKMPSVLTPFCPPPAAGAFGGRLDVPRRGSAAKAGEFNASPFASCSASSSSSSSSTSFFLSASSPSSISPFSSSSSPSTLEAPEGIAVEALTEITLLLLAALLLDRVLLSSRRRSTGCGAGDDDGGGGRGGGWAKKPDLLVS